MSSTIAVAHYPEGAGHATRMLAIADALEDAGADVRMAGGGAGSQFVALNGYDAFEPVVVDYVDTYQDGSMRDVLTRSLPSTLERIADYAAWFDEIDPDAVVTDDMFAAIAASKSDRPLYVLKHDAPALYDDPLERAGASFHTWFQLSVTREFFYPAVWPPSAADPEGATRIGPVALDGDADPDRTPDVVVVPSYYSEFEDAVARLEGAGRDVLNVGADDWDPVPSLLPYVRSADLVVCSGYSTIMDAAVAGTPCVVVPETSEQEAVADWIVESDVTGFAVAETPDGVLAAARDPPAPPAFENGADAVAETVLDDLAAAATATPGVNTDDAGVADDAGAADVEGVVVTDDHETGEILEADADDATETGTDDATTDGPSAGVVSATAATAVGVAATAASGSLSSAFGHRPGRTAAPPVSRSAIAWSLLVGRTDRAAATSMTAVLLGVLVAREVAVGGAYKLVEQLYPTFSSEFHALLFVAALGLVTLAAVGSLYGAGAVPSVLLASAPVLGWAVNYWIGPIAPGYPAGFPLQTVLLYGVVCGVVGYVLGIRLRPLLDGDRDASGSRARVG